MQQDYIQSYWHCALLTGEENPDLTFQIYYDKRGERNNSELAQSFTGKLPDNWNRLITAQSKGCGIFITINETDGKGRTKEHIKRVRAIFADFDGDTIEPQWSLPPSLITKRDTTHFHVYWLVNEDVDFGTFSDLQKRIALYYGSDQQVVNEDRVLRLAGTLHLKDPLNPMMYTITHNNPVKYSAEQIRAFHLMDARREAILTKFTDSRIANAQGIGLEESEHYNKLFAKWCNTNAPIAISEENGTMNLYRTVGWAKDHGIPIDTAKKITWEEYNPNRCEPPWEDWERSHFNDVIDRVYRYGNNAPGCKTFQQEFMNLPPLPEPINGWEENIKTIEEPVADCDINTDNRVNKITGELILASCHAKSAHYDLAQAFDGVVYDGKNIIRSEKQFYIYNGRSWEEIDDDTIKSHIHHAFSNFKPADSLVRGVLNIFCDMINYPKIRNGMWLNNPYRDGSNVVVFKNGYIDFNGNNTYTLKPHDRNYFTFNETDYDYDPNATCPEWDKFLKSVFPGDKVSVDLLHEWIGYCLTSSLDLQKFMLFNGLSRSGKGTITRIISKIVGKSNIISPSLQNLTKDSILHSMSTKKIALINDAHSVNYSSRDSILSMFKAITGCDDITFDRKFKGSMTVQMPVRITMSTNKMPEFDDPSGALVNRMLMLMFSVSFAGREDTTLGERLDKEIPGIVNRCIKGYIRLRNNGNRWSEPLSAVEEREEIREDMFPLSRFVDTCCSLHPDNQASTDELFSIYKLWINTEGIKHPMTKVQFSRTLRSSSLGLKKKRISQANLNGFQGIAIKQVAYSLITKVNDYTPFNPIED